MKHLVLMRHGKSSWDPQGTPDFDRPLSERGLKDVPEMARRMKKKFMPQRIISSDAKRTKETAKLTAKTIGLADHKISWEHGIYASGIEELVHIIRQFDDNDDHVLLIGHNPTFTGMSGFLGNIFIDHMPTSAMVMIELDILSWKQTTRNCGRTIWFDFPKRLEKDN